MYNPLKGVNPRTSAALLGVGTLALFGGVARLRAQSPVAAASTDAVTSALRPSDNVQFAAVAADAPLGSKAAARVQVNGKNFDLEPNKLGHLPRVHVEPNAEIPITMAFEKGDEGEPVTVQVEDGGQLVDTRTRAKTAKLDGSRRVNFRFRVTDQRGLFRVVVRKGAEVKTLHFWVGEPLAVAPIPVQTQTAQQ